MCPFVAAPNVSAILCSTSNGADVDSGKFGIELTLFLYFNSLTMIGLSLSPRISAWTISSADGSRDVSNTHVDESCVWSSDSYSSKASNGDQSYLLQDVARVPCSPRPRWPAVARDQDFLFARTD